MIFIKENKFLIAYFLLSSMGLGLFPQMSNVFKKESYFVTSLGRYAQCRVGRDFIDWKLIRNLLQLFKQKVLKAGIKVVKGQRRGL